MLFLEGAATIAVGVFLGRVLFTAATATLLSYQQKKAERRLSADAEALIQRFETQFGASTEPAESEDA